MQKIIIEDNASETMGYGVITSYNEIVDGDTVTLDCSFAVANSADEDFSEYYDLKVVLKKNKYSCFNGYSISSLSKEESTIQKQNDSGDRTYTFVGSDLGFDNDGVFTFEYLYTLDNSGTPNYEDQMYGKYVQVDLSDNPGLEEYVRQNSGENMIVTYSSSGNATDSVEIVVPTSIKLE